MIQFRVLVNTVSSNIIHIYVAFIYTENVTALVSSVISLGFGGFTYSDMNPSPATD